MKGINTVIETIHGRSVAPRRIRVLADHLCELIPNECIIADVGSGDGLLAAMLQDRKPEISIRGYDVRIRPNCAISVEEIQDDRLPAADHSVDYALLIDVLHHTIDPHIMLAECARVARRGVFLKDHLRKGLLAYTTLRFMDWVGNARYGVHLPSNYLNSAQWNELYYRVNLKPTKTICQLNLYGWPANLLFDRSLHFISLLEHDH